MRANALGPFHSRLLFLADEAGAGPSAARASKARSRSRSWPICAFSSISLISRASQAAIAASRPCKGSWLAFWAAIARARKSTWATAQRESLCSYRSPMACAAWANSNKEQRVSGAPHSGPLRFICIYPAGSESLRETPNRAKASPPANTSLALCSIHAPEAMWGRNRAKGLSKAPSPRRGSNPCLRAILARSETNHSISAANNRGCESADAPMRRRFPGMRSPGQSSHIHQRRSIPRPKGFLDFRGSIEREKNAASPFFPSIS